MKWACESGKRMQDFMVSMKAMEKKCSTLRQKSSTNVDWKNQDGSRKSIQYKYILDLPWPIVLKTDLALPGLKEILGENIAIAYQIFLNTEKSQTRILNF